MNTKRKTVSIADQMVSYIEREGAGRSILFLHGWGGSAESFLPLWNATDSNARLIAIDFPGFGESPEPKEPWDVQRYTQLVDRFLEHLSLDQVDIVNHSFGGRVTTKLLAEYPQRGRKALYLAPAGIRHEKKGISRLASFGKRIFQLPLLRSLFPLLRTVGYKLIGGQDYLQVSGVMKKTFQSVIEEDLSHHFSSISAPVHVVFGKNDTYVPSTDGHRMQKAISGAKLTVFDDGRHGIHKTHAKQIAQIMNTFFIQ
jgi:pimeloyl-ACP methyl ester carboxylesterase